jgi:excisionase family DNA binding protein
VELERLYRTWELAAVLEVPPRTIVDLVRRGKVPFVWIGKRRRYGTLAMKAIVAALGRAAIRSRNRQARGLVPLRRSCDQP